MYPPIVIIYKSLATPMSQQCSGKAIPPLMRLATHFMITPLAWMATLLPTHNVNANHKILDTWLKKAYLLNCFIIEWYHHFTMYSILRIVDHLDNSKSSGQFWNRDIWTLLRDVECWYFVHPFIFCWFFNYYIHFWALTVYNLHESFNAIRWVFWFAWR